MPEKPRPPRKSHAAPTNPHKPEREDVEAELPRSPEPVAEPAPIGATRGPRPQIEREEQ